MNINDYRYTPASVFSAADKLVKMKKEKVIWEVIAKIVEMWEKTNPKEWEAHLIDLSWDKEIGKVTSIGTKQFSHVSKNKGALLRKTLDIPQRVILLIRRLYSPQELPMDKKFFRTWAQKFPKMVVSQKL